MRSRIEKDLQKFIKGKISRRKLMSRAAAVGAVSALPLGILSSESKAAGPKKGGHFRFGHPGGSTTDNLDPTFLTSEFTSNLFMTVYSCLTEIGPDNQLHGLLAESMEPNATADEWVFNLRKGVEFHNGKTLDADDVILSINRHKGEDSKSPTKALAEGIAEMKKDGKHRVIFKMNEPNADFPIGMTAPTFGILAQKDGEIDVSGNGTGSYSLKHFEPGVKGEYERFPNHFRDDVGFFDTCEVTVIHDSSTRSSALMSGEVDYIGGVDPKTADLLAGKPGVTMLEQTGLQHYLYCMDVRKAPYDNPDVRRALKLAMDREDILKKILRGHGTVGNDNPITPAYRYYASDIPQIKYDPDQAKFHMKKSGVGNVEFELSATNGLYEGALDAAVLYSEHAKKAGINIKPKKVPTDGYWSDTWMKAPWSASYWSGRPSEDWMFTQGYAAESSWNETFWKHPEFNKLLKASRGELDENKRRDMYKEMQYLVHDDGGALIFLLANHIAAHGDKVTHGPQVGSNYECDGWKIIERWWSA